MSLLFKIFFYTILLSSTALQAHHYKGEIEASNEFIKHHKQWAKEYHGTSDKKRFLNNLKKFTGKSDVKIKPKLLTLDGMKTKSSLKSYKKKGEMGIVLGAPEHAFRGQEFFTVTADFSKCGGSSNYTGAAGGFSDCKQTKGSSRKEVYDSKKWTFKEGTEKWIHYAFKPVQNVIFKNKERKFSIGQCHPGDNPTHLGITWMVRIRNGNLYIAQWFKHYDLASRKNTGPIVKTSNGTRYYLDDDNLSSFGAGEESSHTLLKKFEANEFNGANDWTSLLIHQVQSMDPNKGLLKIFLDGNYDEPAYIYKGEMGIKTKTKCYFKLGLYTNGNITAKDMTTAENMNIWLDALAIADSKEEILQKIENDK